MGEFPANIRAEHHQSRAHAPRGNAGTDALRLESTCRACACLHSGRGASGLAFPRSEDVILLELRIDSVHLIAIFRDAFHPEAVMASLDD
jgi:hypothetical protein